MPNEDFILANVIKDSSTSDSPVLLKTADKPLDKFSEKDTLVKDVGTKTQSQPESAEKETSKFEDTKSISAADETESISESIPETKTQSQSENPVKNYYTDDELKNLAPDEVDIDRVPESLKPLYQRAKERIIQKAQEAEILRRQVEQSQQAIPKNLYEDFDRDPIGVMNFIQNEIWKRKEALVSGEVQDESQYKNTQLDIIKLERLQNELFNRNNQQTLASTRARQIRAQTAQELRSTVKDFDNKVSDLAIFAQKRGIPMPALQRVLDPLVVGKDGVVSVVKILDELYNIEHGVKSKRRAPTPPDLGKGDKVTVPHSTKNPSNMSYEEYREWRKNHFKQRK